MVLLTMTQAMVDTAKYMRESDRMVSDEHGNLNADSCLDNPEVGVPISHEHVLNLAKRLRAPATESSDGSQDQMPSCRLEHLLRGARVYVEPPKPKSEPSSEYKELMARLRRDEEARAYERMVNPPLRSETFAQRFPSSQHAHLFPTTEQDIGDDDEVTYADINRQMALIINIIISIVACSAALWLAARHWSTPSRLGLSMGGSTMIGVAEVVVYAGYLKRVKEAKAKGKKEVEVKEILKTWIIGSEKEGPSSDVSTSIVTKSNDGVVRRRKATNR